MSNLDVVVVYLLQKGQCMSHNNLELAIEVNFSPSRYNQYKYNILLWNADKFLPKKIIIIIIINKKHFLI